MKHYWNSEIDESFKPTKINVFYGGKEYSFLTSEAVFSKGRGDYGSLLLISSSLDFIPDTHSKVLDLGCGYGMIGLIIASLKPMTEVEMTDVSKRAIALSNLNISDYSLSDRVHAHVRDGFSESSEMYDFIICNPPIRTGKANVHKMLTDAREHLRTGGSLFVVIKKKHGAPSAQKLLKEVYGNCKVINRDKGYYILHSKRL